MSFHRLDSDPVPRSQQMLRTALGPVICDWLALDDVVEIMLNPDGGLWLDRLGEGLLDTGVDLAPVVAAPAFAIRKPAVHALRLDDYVAAGVLTASDARTLAHAVAARRNVLVAGATSSGKTTLANALLAELAERDERVIILEDTVELRCPARNTVALRSKEGVASLADLLRSTLRLRPDRIIVGEVRGPEALDLIKAWGTGHPGGVATIHAGSAVGALRRLEQLIQEAVTVVPRALIAETVDVIAVLNGRGAARRLSQLVAVQDLDGGDYRLVPLGDAR